MTAGRRPPLEPECLDAAALHHCRRVAALAMEISRMAGCPVSMEPALELAAQLQCAVDMTSPSPQPDRRLETVVSPRGLRQHEAVAGIVRLCDLVDEQFESLPFGYRNVEILFAQIQGLAPLRGFDPALVEHFHQMRCRDLPPQITRGDGLPVEVCAARAVFRSLGLEREYEVRELAAFAVRDPVLTTSLIRVANSSLYSPASKLSSVGKAISYIGTAKARRVMLAAVLRPMFASAGLIRLWSHSVCAAQFGSALAAQTDFVSAEEGLILGLLHDFGSMTVQFVTRNTRDLYERLVERGCPTTYVERLIFGCDHGELGAAILARWGFPSHLIEAVRFHHQPERSDCVLAAFAHLVEFWSGLDEDLPSLHRVEDCLARTGLSLESLTGIGTEDGELKTLRSLA